VNAHCESTGKRQYGDVDTAEGELRRLRRKEAKGGKRLTRAYKCPACSWWHITAEDHHDAPKEIRTARRMKAETLEWRREARRYL
jgi:hypothetical protein